MATKKTRLLMWKMQS